MQDLEIFSKAIEFASTEERWEYVQAACGDNPELLSQLVRLLHHHDQTQAASSLEEPLLPALGERVRQLLLEEHEAFDKPAEPDSAKPTSFSENSSQLEQYIDGYRLLEKIGEGGFGQVFVAEQLVPIKRLVALKIIKPGMDSQEIVTRFNSERQALAMMDHPHIARVFDGGTTPRGLPYFVMELVRGLPITNYCDAGKLTIQSRLSLFIQTCYAIGHAHQKGIIHRDIKPSNVLVTLIDGDPVVKVIDFGIAKSLNQRLSDDSFHTRFALMMGTPAYMSPEQAAFSSNDVDTRSDVYSLGVLLYELVAGEPPFPNARLAKVTLDEVRRIILEEEPRSPSANVSSQASSGANVAALRGLELSHLKSILYKDLDWIVMKAIAKDPKLRYTHATDLAEDVQRFLDGRAVQARPPSWTYQVSRFVQRRRGLVATIGLVLMTLVLGSIVSLGLAIWAIGEQQTAQQQETLAEKARDRAEEAERRVTESLLQAKLAFSKLNVESRRVGQQTETWSAVAEAVNLARQTDKWDTYQFQLRSLATTALTRPDIELVETFPVEREASRFVTYNHDFSKVAWRVREAGRSFITVRNRLQPGQDLRVPVPFDTQTQFHDEVKPFLSPNGRFLIFGAPSHGCAIWDLDEYRELATFPGRFELHSVSFSPDSTQLAVVVNPGAGSSVKIYGLPEFTLQQELKVSGVSSLALSSQHHIALAGTKRIDIYDSIAGQFITSLVTSGDLVSSALAWSASGELLASSSTNEIHVWDVPKQTPRVPVGTRPLNLFANPPLTPPMAVLSGHEAQVDHLAFHPSYEYLLVSSSWDDTTRLWNAFSSSEQLSIPFSKPAFSTTDQLAISTPTGVELYRLFAGDICHWICHDRNRDIAFDPQLRWMAVTSTDGIRFWSLPDLRPLARVGRPASLCLWLTDAQPPALLMGNDLGVFEMPINFINKVLRLGPTSQLLPASTSQFGIVQSTRDGRWLAALELSDWDMILLDRQNSLVKRLHRLRRIENFAFSPDSRWLAIAHGETLEVIDLQSNQTLFQHTGIKLAGISFWPDGKRILLSTRQGTRILNTVNWELSDANIQASHLYRVGWTADGQKFCLPARVGAWSVFSAGQFEPSYELAVADNARLNCETCFSAEDQYLCITNEATASLWKLRQLEDRLSELGLQQSASGIEGAPVDRSEQVRIEVVSGELESIDRLAQQRDQLPAARLIEQLEHLPDDVAQLPNAYAMRAESYEARGEHAAACDDWKRALELAPYCVNWQYKYATALMFDGQNAQAFSVYETLADPTAHYRSDVALEQLCMLAAAFPEAIADRSRFRTEIDKWLDAFNESDQSTQSAYHAVVQNLDSARKGPLKSALGMAYYGLGESDLALKLLNESAPAHIGIGYILADLAAQRGDRDQAEKHWRQTQKYWLSNKHQAFGKSALHFYDAIALSAWKNLKRHRDADPPPENATAPKVDTSTVRFNSLALGRLAQVKHGWIKLFAAMPRNRKQEIHEGDLMIWEHYRAGERLLLRLPVPKPGRYRVTANLAGNQHGDFTVYNSTGSSTAQLSLTLPEDAPSLGPSIITTGYQLFEQETLGEFEAEPANQTDPTVLLTSDRDPLLAPAWYVSISFQSLPVDQRRNLGLLIDEVTCQAIE